MTNEERDIITRYIERVGGAPQSSFAGSVPGGAVALPAIDHDADALIGDLFTRYPDARYRLTQTAFVQENALAEAQNRIKRLEWELQQAHQAPPGQPQQAQQPRGFFNSLFGGGQSAPPPQPGYGAPPAGYQQAPPQYQPPPPQYAQGYQPGMFQRSGSGFLGSALTTAAGVAGGMVVGNALMDMFSPHQSFGGGLGGGFGGGGFGAGGAQTIPVDTGGSPWGGGGQDANAAGWDNQTEAGGQGLGGGWDNAAAPQPDSSSGWDQGGASDAGSSDPGGGWDGGGGDTGGGDTGGGDSGGGWDTSNC